MFASISYSTPPVHGATWSTGLTVHPADVAGDVTIDWGDGTPPDTYTAVVNSTTVSHTFPSRGQFYPVITVVPTPPLVVVRA